MTLTPTEEHLYRLIPKDYRLSALSDVEMLKREAVKAERERIRAAVEGLPTASGSRACWSGHIARAAVLAAIDGETT